MYLRVSTEGQNTQNQRMELEKTAKHRDWEIVEVYEDAGISGAKGRNKRPALDALMKDAVRGKFDIVMVWSVDRLGRSLQDLVGTLHDLHAVKVDLFMHQQAIDTSTSAGKALYQMCGVFAEFERSMIQERVKAGLERAKANGKTLGRRKVGEHKEAAILEYRAEGLSYHKIAKAVGVGVSVVQRVLKEAA
ncbi:resolvase [Kordiimonas sediminis]|uniref:Resolvase n=2 Tax=Kordiimonas sediminis TaxID=1735581 RepID=A0A919ALM4_9PROT|nr:resolvase [Kordiimonas sediminis]